MGLQADVRRLKCRAGCRLRPMEISNFRGLRLEEGGCSILPRGPYPGQTFSLPPVAETFCPRSGAARTKSSSVSRFLTSSSAPSAGAPWRPETMYLQSGDELSLVTGGWLRVRIVEFGLACRRHGRRPTHMVKQARFIFHPLGVDLVESIVPAFNANCGRCTSREPEDKCPLTRRRRRRLRGSRLANRGIASYRGPADPISWGSRTEL